MNTDNSYAFINLNCSRSTHNSDIEPSVVHFIELCRVSLPLQHRFVYCVVLLIGLEMVAT
jgi:hypothetical protein